MKPQGRGLAGALLVLVLSVTACDPAAAWTRPNKKKVTAWQGFKNSANGAVQAVLPWNWFGGAGEER